MVIVFDKNIDSNITDVSTDGVSGTAFYWKYDGSNWMVDESGFSISMGADATKITFGSLAAMEPYVAQYKALNTDLHSPFDSIVEDPHYDKPQTGQIISHTYIDTDIEKDLINGDQ